MNNGYEKLNLFFERIKNLSFLQRIFNWKSLLSLSYEAYEEYKLLIGSSDTLSKELDQANNSIAFMKNDNEHLKNELTKLENDVNTLKDNFNAANEKNLQLIHENTIFKQTENDRKTKYEKDVSTLNSIREQIQDDRNKEIQIQQTKEIDRLKSLKETWAKHQDKVKETIKAICQRLTIEYVDKVPFRGSPDNTIKICDEFFIFDAKSPASDDLKNFPTYIKNQTESVKKYVKEENVRKEVFLVIPSNTVEVIDKFSYNLADYNVYIVTLDVLEPLILTLKKIEDYEFVNQLSPEERENICRIIGKFAHMTKRRIQIDHFFAWEFLDILTKCKVDLPKEILTKVIEFEKSEKLNPPIERRAKQILTKDLESDSDKIQKEAEAKEIVFPPSLQKNLRNLPLYDEEESDKSKSNE